MFAGERKLPGHNTPQPNYASRKQYTITAQALLPRQRLLDSSHGKEVREVTRVLLSSATRQNVS